MIAFVALLRAVNLGSHNKIAMADLKALVESLGFSDVQTLLQSGNVTFRGSGAPASIESRLEAAAVKRHALETDFFVRTDSEWAKVIATNPFAVEARADPARVILVTLKDAPGKNAESELNAAVKGRERARVVGRAAYITYPDGQGRSKLTIKVIEKALEASGTARNWNTVLKIRDALYRR